MKFSNNILRFGLGALLWSALALSSNGQTKLAITGKVTELESGSEVVGAGIMVKGTGNGTISDLDGSYSINASQGDTLVCQFIGFRDAVAIIGSNPVINFQLESDATIIDQSVVVGYGTLKKTQLVGAVENLDGDALSSRINANVSRSLQGQVSGLNIIQTDGKPTHSGSIYIRGNSTSYHTRSSAGNAEGATYSIGTGSSALVLIDGVEGDLSQVNPDDVETIAVLKDASSAAVYGARGAFGVVLVTTKKAKEERVTVNLSANVSLNERVIKWEDGIETDGYTWAKSFAEFYQGKDRTPSSSGTFPSDLHRIMPFSQEYLDELYQRSLTGYKNPVAVDEKGNYMYYGSTNWLEEFYTPRHISQTHSLSISGAGKRLSASLSGRYYNQGSIYKIGKESFNNFFLRAKVAFKISDRISIDNNTSMNKRNYLQPYYKSDRPVIAKLIDDSGIPLFVPSNPDGSQTSIATQNGYWKFKNGNDYQDEETIDVTTSTGLDIVFIKDVLKFRADFSYKATRLNRNRVEAASEYSTSWGAFTDEVLHENSFKSRWMYDTNYWTANAVLTWTPKLNEKHDLNTVVGWNAEDYQYKYYRLYRTGLLTSEVPSFELMDGTENNIYNDYETNYSTVGVFARINYSILRRYIFEVSARYDGSSKFPENHKWGFFPSASLGWRLSEEPFMKNAKSWLDNLKIRANVGSLGNANVSPYRFIEKVSVGNSSLLLDGEKVPYANMPSVVPESLTWETVTTYDVGLDWDMFKNRLSFSGDYYIRNNDDVIITGAELPGVYGTSTPAGNYGKIQTKGWELTLSWKDQFHLGGKPFCYSVKASVWDSRTWVREYNNTTGNIFTFYNGKELGEIWGFRTDGIFLSNEEADNWVIDDFHKNGDNFREYAGDLKFVDMDGDGRIGVGAGTLDDHGDLVRIGNNTPRYQFGLNLDASWNNFSISLFFQGVGKRDWYPECESGLFWGQYNRPYSALLKTQEGDNAVRIDYSTPNWVVTNADKNPYWTRQVGYSANRNVGPLTFENDHYIQNVAYVRLKNATLSYSFTQDWMKKAKIEALRIYLTGENLLTFSPLYKHTKMFDPEGIESGDSDFGGAGVTGLYGVGNGYSYPMLRSYTIGVNLTF